MLKKYAVLLGIIISITLLSVSTLYYPGGSQFDKNSTGYDWKNNYLSNLFSEKAVNGADNHARFLAIGGMFFLCASCALFYFQVSKKMPSERAAKAIKYTGVSATVFAFLTVTPLHELMIAYTSTVGVVSMFIVTVFVFKSKLFFLKILSVLGLLSSYCCIFMYYAQSYLELLPIMQKINFLILIIWVLCLEYFTTTADFQFAKEIQPAADDNISTNG